VDNARARHFPPKRKLTATTRESRPGVEEILRPRIAAEMMISSRVRISGLIEIISRRRPRDGIGMRSVPWTPVLFPLARYFLDDHSREHRPDRERGRRRRTIKEAK
jgi:hypothetical protein